MQTIARLDPLRRALATLRRQGKVALVPTMGALHEGHLTLVREARKAAASVVVSIFVNPRQFGAGEDLDAYPRQLAADCALLEPEGVAIVWAPEAGAMYPEGYATNVSVAGVSEGLCGGDRPGHFDGVATVVCKLFNQVMPDLAFFGEKDWQQLAVIRRMARDLDLTRPAVGDIIGVPTVREADGLAMSSRNARLAPDDRRRAVCLAEGLAAAQAHFAAGQRDAQALKSAVAERLRAAGAEIDYVELVETGNLTPVERVEGPALLAVAARLGGVRLIDNCQLGE